MSTDFASFVDAYFDSLFEWAPSYGTAAGLHQYDSRLEGYSQAAIARRIATLKAQHSDQIDKEDSAAG
jgi:hypothetical protein